MFSTEMNRMYNAKNPNQGDAKKVLCVCSAGLLRSPTAAALLNEKYGYNTRSCGVDRSHALIPLTAVLVHWADEIVVMDNYHANVVRSLIAEEELDEKPILVLAVPDRYGYNFEELRELILSGYEKQTNNKEISE